MSERNQRDLWLDKSGMMQTQNIAARTLAQTFALQYFDRIKTEYKS